MAIVEKSIYIDVPPEDLFDFGVYNPQRIPEWFAGVESIKPGANYPEIGSTIDVVYKSAGITLNTIGTVVQLERGKVYAAEYEGMAKGVQTWTYEAKGSGTNLTLHFDYEIMGGGIGKIVDKLVVERQNAKNFEQSLKNLKALVEV
jgi:carbon monoxide dehydrogenase subunit G